MLRKLLFGSLWLALVIYTIVLTIYRNVSASGNSFSTDFDLIINLSLAHLEGINPIITAIFYIMGVFPVVYAAFLLFDNTESKITPYPFVIASFGVGAFALLPYLALRQPNITWNREKNWLLKMLDSRLLAIVSSLTIIILVAWGIIQGNWSDFAVQWQASQFVQVMSLDFCILSCLLPAVLPTDLERRGIKSQQFFWLATLIPVLGTLIYWCLRPSLQDSSK
jgi:hypothetical protein